MPPDPCVGVETVQSLSQYGFQKNSLRGGQASLESAFSRERFEVWMAGAQGTHPLGPTQTGDGVGEEAGKEPGKRRMYLGARSECGR